MAGMRYDVIVAGCGAVGSAALYQLARRGAKALGLDRFAPPHDRGSSHGETRITRLALGEGGEYVQFARRSHQIWRELEAATGRTLLQQVGGLVYGLEDDRASAHGSADFLRTTIEVAQRHGIRHEVLDGAALAIRFPQFRYTGREVGYFEHEGGFVHPEACISAELEVALKLGAVVKTNEPVVKWEQVFGGVRVTTELGTYESNRLILTTGAWLPPSMHALREAARVMRQVLFWFEPDGSFEEFTPDRMPVFIRVPDSEAAMFYGFPAVGGLYGGLKIAGEQFDETVAPDEVRREIGADEIAAMHALASPHLRISNSCVRAKACLYTVTPRFRFVIDRHPESDRVWFASACSGHGFKHSAAVGEALAEAVLDASTTFDLGHFSLCRLSV